MAPITTAPSAAMSTVPEPMSNASRKCGFAALVDCPGQVLQGRVGHLGGEYRGDAADQDAPLDERHLQHQRRGDHRGGGEKVNEEAHLAAHSQLRAAKGAAELAHPGRAAGGVRLGHRCAVPGEQAVDAGETELESRKRESTKSYARRGHKKT